MTGGCAFIPNYEVAKAYQDALDVGGWTEIAKPISKCDVRVIISGDAERVAEN